MGLQAYPLSEVRLKVKMHSRSQQTSLVKELIALLGNTVVHTTLNLK